MMLLSQRCALNHRGRGTRDTRRRRPAMEPELSRQTCAGWHLLARAANSAIVPAIKRIAAEVRVVQAQQELFQIRELCDAIEHLRVAAFPLARNISLNHARLRLRSPCVRLRRASRTGARM